MSKIVYKEALKPDCPNCATPMNHIDIWKATCPRCNRTMFVPPQHMIAHQQAEKKLSQKSEFVLDLTV